MKKLWAFVPFVFVAGVVAAQETAPPPEKARPERQFAGEVITADATAKTLQVKTISTDGQPAEKTLTLPVADDVVPVLEGLKAGDKVTVVWRKDEAKQREVVVALAKTPPMPAPPEKPSIL